MGATTTTTTTKPNSMIVVGSKIPATNGVYHYYGHVMGCDFQNEGGGCHVKDRRDFVTGRLRPFSVLAEG